MNGQNNSTFRQSTELYSIVGVLQSHSGHELLTEQINCMDYGTISHYVFVCITEIVIRFEEENYIFQESESSPTISLNASRSSQQEFLLTIEPAGEVSMSKANVTDGQSIFFTPAPQNNNSMIINIEIANDNVAESNQSQILRLRRLSQSPSFASCVGFLQACSSTTIHITDDDSEEYSIINLHVYERFFYL